ncbi:hypothetical protein N7468_006558 [Penicillium chermesinum]|uniref:Uncharacterized protein n=1 Tax=Penicillium chermesinum TaxID=63820 RepID=A0A9W9TJS5_9EURO|nr:uncharacterized protein N7468_006558 [Penicillium chermesinum]KAJ5225333.1 hypothetical protein N7468_006558 [Penicillium chermesinum]
MSDSNVPKRRDDSKDFQTFVAKTVIGFITMTVCFVLLRLFFPGALAQSIDTQSEVTLFNAGDYTDRVTGVDFTLYTIDTLMDEQDALRSYYSAFINEDGLSKRT